MSQPPNSPTDTHGAKGAKGPMGSDGWVTFFLSNLFIVLGVGIGLAWRTHTVIRTARGTPVDVPINADLVLVPCMRLEQGEVNAHFVQRLERAIALHQTHGAKVLLLGGYTGDAISEAAAGEAYLLKQGVAASSILLEEGSRNTIENMQNARKLIKDSGFDQLVITSNRYHLARCQTLARGMGITALSSAAEAQTTIPLQQWPRFLLEAYYLHWYTTGKLWSRLTKNSHSLARIS